MTIAARAANVVRSSNLKRFDTDSFISRVRHGFNATKEVEEQGRGVRRRMWERRRRRKRKRERRKRKMRERRRRKIYTSR